MKHSIKDKQETSMEVFLQFVFHYILVTSTTFGRLAQCSIQQRAHACVYSTNVMQCSLCCLYDLVERHFCGLLVAPFLPSASTKVSA